MYIRVPQSHLCTLMQDNGAKKGGDDEKKGDDPDQ